MERRGLKVEGRGGRGGEGRVGREGREGVVDGGGW